MYSESRKATRNSFAHHRAYLLFSPSPKSERDDIERRRVTDSSQRRAIVRNGLIGYIPAGGVL
jgi:hypothetical protein